MATKYTGTLASREARKKLKARANPYYATIGKNIHLGYRRLAKGAGAWSVRRFVDGKYQAEGIGTADDLAEADGGTVLSFWQASEVALDRAAERKQQPRRKRAYKVKD